MAWERAMFKVVGMYCSTCKSIVEKQLEYEKGVKNIDINYMTDSVITLRKKRYRISEENQDTNLFGSLDNYRKTCQ